MDLDTIHADVVVAGGGAGGIAAAYHAHRAGASVLLLGGGGAASDRVSSINAALDYTNDDSAARLFDDIYRSGGYLGAPSVIAEFASGIGPEIERLHRLGVPFAMDGNRLARRQATGSTWKRSVYSTGLVGAEIGQVLLDSLIRDPQDRFTLVRGGLALRLESSSGRTTGGLAYDPRRKTWLAFSCGAVVLATGGAGQIFDNTTNPAGHRGTGYSMALELGASLVDMEFVSFEPFVSTVPADHKGDDLPTTVLYEGARLLNGRGEEFIDSTTSLTKDVICRAMVREVNEGRGTVNDSVLYDIRGMEPEVVLRYVQIRQALDKRGMPPDQGLIEVMPAQHYLMGGILIDNRCASTVPGLFAFGEVSGGIHGAHRLAGAGGTEIVAGGLIAGTHAAQFALDATRTQSPKVVPDPALLGSSMDHEDRTQLSSIRRAMSGGCGVLRNRDEINVALTEVLAVHDRTSARPGTLIHRAATLAVAIASSALARNESRGDHFRTDHPNRDDRQWLYNQRTRLDPDGGVLLDGLRVQPLAVPSH